jgi:ribosomal protein S18 acetylase RimI-like enzyme
MDLRIITACNGIDWEAVSGLFQKVGWGNRGADRLRRAFERSLRVCFVFDGDRLVAFGRAVSDGEFYAAIYDVIVDPSRQRQGIGRTVMRTLLDGLGRMAWIHLASTPGNEGFYARLGFRKQKTAMALLPDTPGSLAYVE